MSLGSEVDRFLAPPLAVHREHSNPPHMSAISDLPLAQSLTVPENPNGRGRGRSIASSLISSDDAEVQCAHARVSTWVDGPFGEYQRPLHRHFEGFITVARDSGLSAGLPWIMYLANKMQRAADAFDDENCDCRMRNVTFVWSIRKADWICWARREMIHALRAVAVSEGCFRAVICHE